MRQGNYWFEDVYQRGSLKWLPFSCEINVDFPVGVIGKLNYSVIRVPMVVHDCGCGISVIFLRDKPTEEQLKKITSVYETAYRDAELDCLIPSDANLPLRKSWRFYEKQYSPDDELQKTRVYFCKDSGLFAMRYHYSHHDSCDRVLRYCLDKFGENVKGDAARFVINLAKVLQEYSIRARRDYVKKIGEIVELCGYIDCPHVSIDEDGIFRFGVQRGETVVQTTDQHLWLFDGMLSEEFYGCSVGSFPGMTHLLDQEKFFNEYCEKTRHLATLRETYVAIT